jgi:hypothetical protein
MIQQGHFHRLFYFQRQERKEMTDSQELTQGQSQELRNESSATPQTEPEQPQTGTQSTLTLEQAIAELAEARKESAARRVELKKLREAQEATTKAQQAADEKRMAEQNQFKELYEQARAKLGELEPLQTKWNDHLEAVKARNEKRIAAIPESMRPLVPDYEDPLKLADWLEANQAMLGKPIAPTLDGGAGQGGNGALPAVTDAEVADFATRMGVRPDTVDRHKLALAKLKR